MSPNRYLRGKQRKAKAANDPIHSHTKDGHSAADMQGDVMNSLKVSDFHSYKYGDLPTKLVSLGFTLARIKMHVKAIEKAEAKGESPTTLIRKLVTTTNEMDEQITRIMLDLKKELDKPNEEP